MKLRFGILSTGNIARQFAQGLKGSARCEVTAVGSRTQVSADTFAKTHSIPSVHSSYEALLADDTVDAIYLAAPNNLHHKWAMAALEAGKHVLCEKPFAVTVEQSQEMFDTAKKHGRVLIEAFMYRCHPQTIDVLALIRSGRIGPIKHIHTSFCFSVPNWKENSRFSVELAGGSLMDIGCYCIDFATLVAGEDPVQTHVEAHLHKSGIDDYAAGTLRFASGMISSFTCGMTLQANNALTISGEKGYVTVDWPWKPPADHATYSLHTQVPPKLSKGAGNDGPWHESFEANVDKPLYAMEADAFAATVFDGETPFVTEQETMRTMRILEDLRKQAGLPF